MQAVMIRLMTAACVFSIPSSQASAKSCSEQLAPQNSARPGSKPMSYDDCVKQARIDCERTARDRKLIDVAKESFMKRCLAESIGK
ncbi:hypothetical protein PHIN6_03790 [Polynucleobacter sp. HIN6]|uniref:hypothetical protein n=1 Tax=Polynucleobacter sp. HIN6 TaxID=3047865 RepID=UPI002572E95F|nr:hypothetical protein [Polynucleobacter sp. HIN6]BEI34861.1 hypothetical protein PHIN6_03790 [Polynucleobacter sp. HIN6]